MAVVANILKLQTLQSHGRERFIYNQLGVEIEKNVEECRNLQAIDRERQNQANTLLSLYIGFLVMWASTTSSIHQYVGCNFAPLVLMILLVFTLNIFLHFFITFTKLPSFHEETSNYPHSTTTNSCE